MLGSITRHLSRGCSFTTISLLALNSTWNRQDGQHWHWQHWQQWHWLDGTGLMALAAVALTWWHCQQWPGATGLVAPASQKWPGSKKKPSLTTTCWGLSTGPRVPPLGTTVNMSHMSCGHASVFSMMNLQNSRGWKPANNGLIPHSDLARSTVNIYLYWISYFPLFFKEHCCLASSPTRITSKSIPPPSAPGLEVRG